MIALLIAAVCGVWPTPHADSPTDVAAPMRVFALEDGVANAPVGDLTTQDPTGKPLKALDAWLKLYRRGKIDYRSKKNLGKGSIAAKYKVRSKDDLGDATWASDLRMILKEAAKRNDPDAARAMTLAAAVGLDKGKYSYAMAPYEVRAAALEAMAKLDSEAAKEELAVGARGEWKDRKRGKALRAGALLALGHIGDKAYVPVVTAALADGEPVTRIHAVQALQKLADEPAIKALIGVVERENDDAVLVTAAKALRNIYSKHLRDVEDGAADDKPKDTEGADDKAGEEAKPGGDGKADESGKAGEAGKDGDAGKDADANQDADKGKEPAKKDPLRTAPKSARLAVRAAIKALGRTNWRADMVLVRLLDDFRSAESVPALIGMLERFRDNPKDLETGKLSTLLKFQVHELLVSMTGAVYSAQQPEKWRDLWNREKDKIAVAQKQPVNHRKGGTSAAGFVGIPVEGSRVVFILDLSGSMEWPMKDEGKKVRRLDYAKRELLKATDALSPNAMFNLVTFNGDDEAESWSKKLVPANKRNRDRFTKFVEKLRPLGGTNLWSGMESALNIKTLVYGNTYETTIDEIFLLSDGAPSVGDVQDPIEILRLVREVNRFKEVRINTVFISSETPPRVAARQREMSLTPKELMRRMAKQNGGKFRDV